jgi:crotonobetainyl-CoA:carnitine CoA-transferase CaiB-like acyl-CoA transferase
MNAWLATRTNAQAIAELESARIPAGPVLRPQEVMDDAQVKARELLQNVEFPGTPGSVPLAAPAARLSATPGSIRHRAPLVGEQTDEIMREIGYSDQQIQQLRRAEIL